MNYRLKISLVFGAVAAFATAAVACDDSGSGSGACAGLAACCADMSGELGVACQADVSAADGDDALCGELLATYDESGQCGSTGGVTSSFSPAPDVDAGATLASVSNDEYSAASDSLFYGFDAGESAWSGAYDSLGSEGSAWDSYGSGESYGSVDESEESAVLSEMSEESEEQASEVPMESTFSD